MTKFRVCLFLSIVLALAFGGALFAGGGGESAGKAQGPTTISYTWWGADVSRDKKYNDLTDAFEKSHPNIKVSRQIASWNDYWIKLTTQVAGGNAPDVMGMHLTKEADFVQRGALMDLTSYVASKAIDTTNIPKSVIDAGSLNGKILMIAQGVTMTGVGFNTAVFDKYKIAYPTNDWTWEDLGKMAVALYEAKKKAGDPGWGVGDDSGGLTSLMVWSRERGKNVFTPDGKLGIDEQDMIEWFTMWDKLRKTGALPDAATTVQHRPLGVEQTMFVKGLVPMTFIPFNQLPNFQRYVQAPINLVLRPKLPGGKNGQIVEGSYLTIFAKSKYAKEGAEFINFFVNSPEVSKIFLLEQGAMASSKSNDAVMPLLSPIQQRMINAIQEGLKTATEMPIPPAGSNQIEVSALRDAADAVAFGALSIPAAAKQFVAQATKILETK